MKAVASVTFDNEFVIHDINFFIRLFPTPAGRREYRRFQLLICAGNSNA